MKLFWGLIETNISKESIENTKSIVQLLIVIVMVGGYVYLVATKKAQVEGFVMLAMYIIKKFLDLVELKLNGGQK